MCPIFDVVHPAFPVPTTASSTLQGVLNDSFAEAVVACDMPEPCKFPSPDSCQKRFLWTHKEVDLPPHPVVGLVLQVEDAKKFPQALGFKIPVVYTSHFTTYTVLALSSVSVCSFLDVSVTYYRYHIIQKCLLGSQFSQVQ